MANKCIFFHYFPSTIGPFMIYNYSMKVVITIEDIEAELKALFHKWAEEEEKDIMEDLSLELTEEDIEAIDRNRQFFQEIERTPDSE